MKLKVSQLNYERADYEQSKTKCEEIFANMKKAEDVKTLLALRNEYLDIIDLYATMNALCYARFTLNTRDEFYAAEVEYYDNVSPLFTQLTNQYIEIMLNSPLRPQAEKILNPKLFDLYECSVKATPPEIVAERQEENKIVTEYSVLISQLLCEFNGEKVPLSVVRGKLDDKDRNVRKAAANSIGLALSGVGEKIDDIFDRLVKIRDKQAKKLGYENFIPLGYYRMQRIDYDREMVEKFRKNVKESIVPAVCELKEKLRQKLGLDKIMFYDDPVYTENESPRMILKPEEAFAEASKMYHEMSPKLGKFFDEMVETEAFDVLPNDGKMSGGYCTVFPDYKQVFIFANFNGSADDVATLTHEFGHAYAFRCSLYDDSCRELEAGLETCECHSMSMETFCNKYMDRFLGESAAEFEFIKNAADLCFIPYGVIVDEFQHVIYEHPELTPAQRKNEWLKLEAKYRPFLSFEGIPYLEEGTRWQYQGHIFESPFYYIDYCLAQTVALGFMVEAEKDYDKAFEKYMKMVETFGNKRFYNLIADAGVAYPFGDGTLSEMAKTITEMLNKLSK